MNNFFKFHRSGVLFFLLFLALSTLGCDRQNASETGKDSQKPAAAPALAKEGQPAVSVTIDFLDGYRATFDRIPWTEGMTGLDCMEAVRKHPRGPMMVIKGAGETAFLTKIEEAENGSNGGAAWIYYINGEQAKESFGRKKVNEGDAVLWKFEEYR